MTVSDGMRTINHWHVYLWSKGHKGGMYRRGYAKWEDAWKVAETKEARVLGAKWTQDTCPWCATGKGSK